LHISLRLSVYVSTLVVLVKHISIINVAVDLWGPMDLALIFCIGWPGYYRFVQQVSRKTHNESAIQWESYHRQEVAVTYKKH